MVNKGDKPGGKVLNKLMKKKKSLKVEKKHGLG
jgi:hypothetical protein